MASTRRHHTHTAAPPAAATTHNAADFCAAKFFNEWRSLKLIVVCGRATDDDLAIRTQPTAPHGVGPTRCLDTIGHRAHS